MLRVENINFSYGLVQVLHDVGFNIVEGEFVALLGSNGAGKTTLLKTISGLLKTSSGSIMFQGSEMINSKPVTRIKAGLIQVPEGGKIFPYLSVWDNLMMGASGQQEAWKQRYSTAERVHSIFPILKDRRNQQASSLSGGERQMLVIGRGLMSLPKLLMVDEPSIGLAPKILLEIFDILKTLREEGVTILLSEQNVQQALKIAERAYVLENGKIVMEDSSEMILKSDHIKKVYLGM